jgi:hypothetical protein
MKAAADDLAEARRLFEPPSEHSVGAGYHHDHDEELGFRFNDSPQPRKIDDGDRLTALLDSLPSRLRSRAYWIETGTVVMDYFELQAGARYSQTLRYRFIAWLKRSPAERRQYEAGDDMSRAALVDWYLRVVE